MTYYSQSDFLPYVNQRKRLARTDLAKGKILQESPDREHVFISYASEDRVLVMGIIDFLNLHGIRAYVDVSDDGMPATCSGRTADRLRQKIESCKGLLLVATTNAVYNSRWVPWEVGCADGIHGSRGIVVLPIADPNGRWVAVEYLQTYRQLKPGFIDEGRRRVAAVFEPHQQAGQILDANLGW